MASKKSVIIIGGGIAGLAAARELLRRQCSITLLEAQNRLGGRIRTIQHRNVPIELGPEFVHGKSRALLAALAEAKLATPAVSGRNRLFRAGRFEAFEVWERAGEIFERINPDKPDVPFAEFLARQADVPAAIRNATLHFVEGFNAANARRISSHALLRAERAAAEMNGSEQFRVTPGYSALVDFLARQIEAGGGVVVKNARARHISWSPRHAAVSFEQGGRLNVVGGDAAVISLPVGILRTNELNFSPAIPEKIEAARGLEFGNVVKIILQFAQPFWSDFGFVHALDQPIPTWWDDPRGPILTGWAGGPRADALLGCSRWQLEEMGLNIIAQFFSAPVQLLRKKLVASHYWDWSADPCVRGAYSYIPVNGLGLTAQLAEPVADTLFFAGEATVADAQTGTVFGALESGLRAAREAAGCPRMAGVATSPGG